MCLLINVLSVCLCAFMCVLSVECMNVVRVYVGVVCVFFIFFMYNLEISVFHDR